MTDQQIAEQDCCHAVLEALAARKTGSFTVPTIKSVLLRGQDFDLRTVENAVQMLVMLDPPLVKVTPDDFGGEKNVQITTAGVLKHVRS